MTNVTGGQVAVTGVGTTDNSGGILTTTGDAIVLSNVTNADFSNIQIANSNVGVNIDHSNAATTGMDITFTNLDLVASAGLGIDVDGASAQAFNLRLNNSNLAEGVDMDSTGSGSFKVLLDNTDIDDNGAADIAFSITFADTADGDLTVRNGSDITAINGRAFEMFVNNSGTAVAALIENGTFTSATVEDMFIENTTGAVSDLTIRNNTFANSGALNDVFIRSLGSAGAGTRVDLNLVGNGNVGSTIRLLTDEDAVAPSNFGVVDLPNVDANNPATVTLDPLRC